MDRPKRGKAMAEAVLSKPRRTVATGLTAERICGYPIPAADWRVSVGVPPPRFCSIAPRSGGLIVLFIGDHRRGGLVDIGVISSPIGCLAKTSGRLRGRSRHRTGVRSSTKSANWRKFQPDGPIHRNPGERAQGNTKGFVTIIEGNPNASRWLAPDGRLIE
jgi:hypothetical protein